MVFVETGYRHLKRYGKRGWSNASALLSPHMSPRLFFLDFYVYPPLIIAAALAGCWNQPLISSMGLIISGYAVWTLFEYVLHRIVLHHVPFFAEMHQEHHDHALQLIGTPTIVSMFLLYTAAYLPLSLMLGTRAGLSVMAGFMAGYISYVGVHYLVHHKGSGGYRFMRKLVRQHAIHHGSEDSNFGVTTVFWDKIFGTCKARIKI